MTPTIRLLTTLLVLASGAAAGTDSHRLLDDALTRRGDVVGEIVKLNAGDQRLLALHQPSQQSRVRGAVLLLHAPGSNADDVAIIRPLRLGLSAAGWHTLALQLPATFAGESPSRWLARHGQLAGQISAGLDWLKQQGDLNQVLLGVGASASGVLRLISAKPPREVRAFVMISAPLLDREDDSKRLAALAAPVLDLYAQRDRPDVIAAAPAKRRAAAARPRYRQRVVPGALPGFQDTADNLVAQVRGWLAANTDDRTEAESD